MSRTPLQAYGVNDKDLTEIELQSVDSIDDLHRTHPERKHKGTRPPRPAYTPSVNGAARAKQPGPRRRGPPVDTAACAVFTLLLLLLLALVLVSYFLAQQGSTLQRLTEALRDKPATSTQVSALIQQLQALALNLTAARGRA